jgi:uncharacterized protein YceK
VIVPIPAPNHVYRSNPTLQARDARVRLAPLMVLINRCWLLFLIPLFLSGCSSITNLTPSKLARNPNGFYPFEVAWQSKQQSLRKESIRVFVIMDFESYPMPPTQVVKNRWETLVPIPASKRSLSYRYKFDYEYNSIPVPKKESVLSRPYQLEITDK